MKIMLDPGQLFDSFALLAKLIQKEILLDGKPAHPPKTNTPANGPGQGHPESEVVFIHKIIRGSSNTGAGFSPLQRSLRCDSENFQPVSDSCTEAA
jgi:hypothetical protein